MLLSPEFILVKEITSNVPRSNFNESDIQELAELILEAEGLIKPITVIPTGIDSYEVIDGHLEYWAAVRAKEINPRKGERITAIVIEGPKANAIEKQVQLLNKIHSKTTEKQPQETAQKIEIEPVITETEKVNHLQKTTKKIKPEQKQPQKNTKKLKAKKVTVNEEKVNLCTVKGPQLKKAFTNKGMKWTNQIWFVVNYWTGPGHKLSWDNLEKSAKPGPDKIMGFGMAAVNNLRQIGDIPE